MFEYSFSSVFRFVFFNVALINYYVKLRDFELLNYFKIISLYFIHDFNIAVFELSLERAYTMDPNVLTITLLSHLG